MRISLSREYEEGYSLLVENVEFAWVVSYGQHGK